MDHKKLVDLLRADQEDADLLALAAAKVVSQLPISVKVKKLHPDARLPVYGTDGAACFDLAALDSNYVAEESTARIRTGLSFEIPEGHVMLIFSRSGHGFKNNVRLANCVGVIDADYRGEVMVKLTKDSGHALFTIEPGDRIAQAMVIPFPRVTFEEVEELSSTERGTGGFGSTGVK